MTTGDGARHALYTQLEDVLGHEHADTLMTYLPTHGSDQFATKGDFSRLEARLGEGVAAIEQRMDGFEQRMGRFEQRMDGFEQRMGRFEQRMDQFGETIVSQQQFFARSMVGAMVALTAIFSLVVAFFG